MRAGSDTYTARSQERQRPGKRHKRANRDSDLQVMSRTNTGFTGDTVRGKGTLILDNVVMAYSESLGSRFVKDGVLSDWKPSFLLFYRCSLQAFGRLLCFVESPSASGRGSIACCLCACVWVLARRSLPACRL